VVETCGGAAKQVLENIDFAAANPGTGYEITGTYAEKEKNP
jgi:hypothetical protein